jgi:hypothetical protein
VRIFAGGLVDSGGIFECVGFFDSRVGSKLGRSRVRLYDLC